MMDADKALEVFAVALGGATRRALDKAGFVIVPRALLEGDVVRLLTRFGNAGLHGMKLADDPDVARVLEALQAALKGEA